MVGITDSELNLSCSFFSVTLIMGTTGYFLFDPPFWNLVVWKVGWTGLDSSTD